MNDLMVNYFDKNSINYWDSAGGVPMAVFAEYNKHKDSILVLINDTSFVSYIDKLYDKVRIGGRITDICKGGKWVAGKTEWKQYSKEMMSLYLKEPTLENLNNSNVKINVIEEYVRAKVEHGSDKYKKILTHIKSIKKIRERIVRGNQRLVYSVVKKYSKSAEIEVDLLQEGSMGLVYAIDMFNYKADIKFSTYATWWIRQYVSKNIARHENLVHVPASMHSLRKKASVLFEELGSVSEVAEAIGLSVLKTHEILNNLNTCSSLNDLVGDDGDEKIIFLEADSAMDSAKVDEKKDELENLMVKLDNRERLVVRLRHGVGVSKEHTLEEVGEVIGVTRERARQIEKKAVEKMRFFALNN
jgi:RNA polymerase sigma factor (sigma-70 family)